VLLEVASKVSAKTVTDSLAVIIISWPGKEENALYIEQVLAKADIDATVIHSLTGPHNVPLPENWVVLGEDAFYGVKFAHSLTLAGDRHMLHIHADTQCDNWVGLVRRCHDLHTTREDLGVWSPNVDWTPFSLSRTHVKDCDSEHLSVVTMVDAIVWSLSKDLVQRLRLIDFTENSHGWRIEMAAASHAHSRGLLVLHDSLFHVDHPRSTGYVRDEAFRQGQSTVDQLSELEKKSLDWLNQDFGARLKKEKNGFGARVTKARKALLDAPYVLLRRGWKKAGETG
jgi:hypothetical protein